MNLIFDFDGTICDSFDLVIRVTNQYLKKLNKKTIDKEELHRIGVEEMIKDYKLNKLQALIYVLKGRRELARHTEEMKIFKGMPEIIQKLAISNHLAVVSSNSKSNIEKILKRSNLEKYFDFIASSPTIFDKAKKINNLIQKYNFKRDETVYIGDEVRDIEAARKAGIKSVAVTWGFADESLLAKHEPDLIIDAPKELVKI